MKRILFLAFFISSIAVAQIPQGISYQAVALNGSTPVVNANVGIKLSVLNNTSTGPVLYAETHLKATNAQGLFNLVIGQGTPLTGTFQGINWSTGSKFLKVEMDNAGGTNYALIGTTQLLSVPYAMYAASTASVPASALSGAGTSSLKATTFLVRDGVTVKGYYNGTWASQTFSDNVYDSDITEMNGTFIVRDNYSVRCFSKGVWTTQTFPDYIYSDDVFASNDVFLVKYGNTVRGFANGSWSTATFSDNVYDSSISSSEGAFIVRDNNVVKAFYNGAWTTQTFSDTVYSDDITISNGNFLIRDANGTVIKSFYKGNWAVQNFTQTIYSDDIFSSETN